MLKERPKSKFEDKNGFVNIGLVEGPDYPEIVEWDKQFAAECDQLSAEYAAKTKYQHWGRWFLDTRKPMSLITFSSRPSVKVEGWYSDVRVQDSTIWEAGAESRYRAVLIAEWLLHKRWWRHLS